MKEEKMLLIMKHTVCFNLAWQWRYLTDKTGFLFIGTHCIAASKFVSVELSYRQWYRAVGVSTKLFYIFHKQHHSFLFHRHIRRPVPPHLTHYLALRHWSRRSWLTRTSWLTSTQGHHLGSSLHSYNWKNQSNRLDLIPTCFSRQVVCGRYKAKTNL